MQHVIVGGKNIRCPRSVSNWRTWWSLHAPQNLIHISEDSSRILVTPLSSGGLKNVLSMHQFRTDSTTELAISIALNAGDAVAMPKNSYWGLPGKQRIARKRSAFSSARTSAFTSCFEFWPVHYHRTSRCGICFHLASLSAMGFFLDGLLSAGWITFHSCNVLSLFMISCGTRTKGPSQRDVSRPVVGTESRMRCSEYLTRR